MIFVDQSQSCQTSDDIRINTGFEFKFGADRVQWVSRIYQTLYVLCDRALRADRFCLSLANGQFPTGGGCADE
jgi:hypothetical protein